MKPFAPRILLVDDEPDIVESCTDLLRSFLVDVQVEPAYSGEEALERLRLVSVDLIVTDFRMPGMNGLELMHAALSIAPGTPCILVTAYANEGHGIRDADTPPHTTLRKPFEIDAFQGAVEQALAAN